MYKETIYQEKILTGGSILEGLAGRYPALKACRSVLYGVGQPPDDGICGNYDGLIRGCTSTDLLHWSKPQVWAETPLIGGDSHIHPLLVEHLGKLYGFFVCWREGHCPTTELFELDDAAGRWLHHPESALKGFVPFCTPQKLDDGNWILGGGRHWYEASVAISGGGDFTKWTMIDAPRPEGMGLLYPECAVVHRKDRLLLVCRPAQGRPMFTAPCFREPGLWPYLIRADDEQFPSCVQPAIFRPPEHRAQRSAHQQPGGWARPAEHRPPNSTGFEKCSSIIRWIWLWAGTPVNKA